MHIRPHNRPAAEILPGAGVAVSKMAAYAAPPDLTLPGMPPKEHNFQSRAVSNCPKTERMDSNCPATPQRHKL